MPYADPEQRRAYDRRRYVEKREEIIARVTSYQEEQGLEKKRVYNRTRLAVKYATDPKHVEAAKARARANYEKNREKVIARVLARRAALKAAKEGK